MNNFAFFIKYQRKKLGFTQFELAQKAGVGLRFIRDLEQGKDTLQLNKISQVLGLFGYSLVPAKQRIDPYSIYFGFMNKPITIALENKEIKQGIIISEVLNYADNKIFAWKFIPNKIALLRKKKYEPGDVETILHSEIQDIQLQ